MDPLTIALMIALSSMAIVVMWPHILHYLTTVFLPFVKANFSDATFRHLTELFVFLDGKFCPARELLLRGWKLFNYHVLGIKTTYEKTGASTARATTETLVRTEDSRVVKQTSVEEVAWNDIPADIRAQMIKEQRTNGVVDTKAAVHHQMHERCAEAGILTLQT